MEKKNNESKYLNKNHFGLYWEDWDFELDLNFTYSELLRCLLNVVLSKFRLIPQKQKKPNGSVWS